MTYLSVENLSKQFGLKKLFENLTFGISKGEKTALIAPNGTGKSTLLKILGGQETQDAGKVIIRNGLKIGYLVQQPEFEPTLSVGDLILHGDSEFSVAVRNYERAVHNQAIEYNEKTHAAFEKATEEMNRLNAWDFERKMIEILGKLNIHDLEQLSGSLSGGEKKRVALAFTLLDEPDLLLLDEPTNHLDIDMIEWLERHLARSNTSLLMVTHDRVFLDNVCTHILELSGGKLYHHKGNYAYYLEKKAEREEIEDTDLAKAGQLYKQELAWMRRQPKARTTKSKSRIDSFYKTEDRVKQKVDDSELKLDVRVTRMGNKIVELKHIHKKYDDTVILDDFNYSFSRGERIGIVGKNGAGKSTFLNILTGTEKPDSGEIITGETIVFGDYKQQGIQVDESMRVIDVIKEVAEVITMGNGNTISASKFLEQFLFTPEMQYTPVQKLSGGERRRLGLMMVLIKNPNFLILDEPTNDLDLPTLQKLEHFLDGFGGCLIVVTHDRFFMDRIVDHLFVFEGGGKITNYNGSYLDYRAEKDEEEQLVKEEEKAKAKAKSKAQAPATKVEVKRSREDEKRIKKLMKEIEDLEAKKASLEERLSKTDLSVDEITETSEKYAAISGELDEKLMEWLEIEG